MNPRGKFSRSSTTSRSILIRAGMRSSRRRSSSGLKSSREMRRKTISTMSQRGRYISLRSVICTTASTEGATNSSLQTTPIRESTLSSSRTIMRVFPMRLRKRPRTSSGCMSVSSSAWRPWLKAATTPLAVTSDVRATSSRS